jgi:hypothetical protein
MCLPLDESRELFETEKVFFRWLKGDSEQQISLISLGFDSHIAPLVVIFTKRDGAVAKVTQSIKDSSSSLEGTFSRASKKQARATADIEVTKRVKEREEELRQLSQANSAITFLTTSGM